MKRTNRKKGRKVHRGRISGQHLVERSLRKIPNQICHFSYLTVAHNPFTFSAKKGSPNQKLSSVNFHEKKSERGWAEGGQKVSRGRAESGQRVGRKWTEVGGERKC